MPRLAVIAASSRPTRVALPMAQWFDAIAREHGGFDVDFIDLAEVNLPFLDEPNHPRLRQYEHEHTKAWSERIDAADAFVFVTPEYNYGMPAILKNAVDFLHHEWTHKPVGFVSYGGVSAGTRSVQMAKQVLTTLRMFPVFATVSIPFVHDFLDDEQRFVPNETASGAAKSMLDELVAVEKTMRPLRQGAPEA